ncbi:NUDIX domain-containing protein [Actinomycetes bacterium KLBMP 9759]
MPAFPVSVKGVLVDEAERVLLLRNDRAEWELPGGRIEIGETPEACVAREIREETGWDATTGPILDAWMYVVEVAAKHVFIVTYGCRTSAVSPPVRSAEHTDVGLFTQPEVAALPMPDGYRRSIAAWFADPRRPR